MSNRDADIIPNTTEYSNPLTLYDAEAVDHADTCQRNSASEPFSSKSIRFGHLIATCSVGKVCKQAMICVVGC
jgi:hypothetical protein